MLRQRMQTTATKAASRRARRTTLLASAVLAAGALWAGCGERTAPRDGTAPELPAPERAVRLSGQPRAFVDSLRAVEARHLEQTGGRLQRVSIDRLWLVPSEGEPVAFDDMIDGEIALLHVYRARMPPGFAIIEQIHMEGGSFLLVNERTGAQHRIDDMPAVSPDGARFATASFDVVAGHMPNRLVVYRIGEGGPAVEWTLAPQEWGPTDVEWLDDHTLTFLRNDLDMTTQPYTVHYSPMTAQLTDTGWRVLP